MWTKEQMPNNELLKSGIQTYTGHAVTDLKRFDDPVVAGAIALRATVDDVGTIDFLLSAGSRSSCAEDVADNLEEVEYKTWPPRSGVLKLF